jgi:hypothetical protein
MCSGGNAGADAGGAEVGLGALLTATGYGSALGVPLMLSGAGSAVGGLAQQEQLNKQSDIAAAGIIKQGELQKQGEADVGSTIQTASQSTAAAQAKTAQQLAAYRSALQQGTPQTQAASPSVPGASKAFKAAQTSATGSANDYVNAIAQSAATTQGTQLERVGENQQMAQTASDLGVLTNQSNEQNYLTQLKVRATQQNPWLTALGMTLQGAGMAAGIAGGAGAANTAAANNAAAPAAAELGGQATLDTGDLGLAPGYVINNPAYGSGLNAFGIAQGANAGNGVNGGIGGALGGIFSGRP